MAPLSFSNTWPTNRWTSEWTNRNSCKDASEPQSSVGQKVKLISQRFFDKSAWFIKMSIYRIGQKIPHLECCLCLMVRNHRHCQKYLKYTDSKFRIIYHKQKRQRLHNKKGLRKGPTAFPCKKMWGREALSFTLWNKNGKWTFQNLRTFDGHWRIKWIIYHY